MRQFIVAFTVLLVLCLALCASLAAVPSLNLFVMSASDLKQLQKDIQTEIKAHHEMNSTTENAVKDTVESVTEKYYQQKGISISWAWHSWEYDYKRDKDFFSFKTHLDYKDSNNTNHQVKVAADLIWDGREYRLYHLYLDNQLALSDEANIPSEHLIDISNMVVNEKTGLNLSLVSEADLKDLEKAVQRELDNNHNPRNSGRVNDILKKTVEKIYADKGIQKVEWPWFDYEYTCDWNCYTEKTRITYEENGKKIRDIPVYAEMFPEGNNYIVYYLKIGDEVVTDNLNQVNSGQGKLFLNSRKYEEAKQLLAEGQYEQAMVLFNELGDFDDSAQMLTESLDRYTRSYYDKACLLQEGGNWEKAVQIFDSLGTFSDSAVRAEACRIAINDNTYNAALALMNAGSYDKAIESFAMLSGYLDSNAKAEECREVIRKNQYNSAVERMSSGDYTEAIALFVTLGGYADSEAQVANCQEKLNQQAYDEAEALFAAGNYAKAGEAFALLGDFDDSAEKTAMVREIVSSMDREISFVADEIHLFPGEMIALAPEISKTEETAPDDTMLVYSSANPKVASVDTFGTVTAVSSGETVIHCEAADNTYINADVAVHVAKNVNKVILSDSKLDMAIPGQNSEHQLMVIFDPEDAYIQTGVWSSSNEAVAMVDQEGTVTAVGNGKAVISFLSDDTGKAKKEAKCNVTVTQAVTEVRLNELYGTIYVGKPITLKATIEPKTAKNKKVEWSSSNESVATVSSNGQVKGVSPGSVVITAKSPDGPSDNYHATVKMPPVTLKVSAKAQIDYNDHVGRSWGKQLYVNGGAVNGSAKVTVENGDIITVQYEVWENDKWPDEGSCIRKIEITPEIMTKGITIEEYITVYENGGRYSGHSAGWSVTITIKP